MIPGISHWFLTYGFAEVGPELFAGAYPLDSADVATLARAGVDRVLNLVEDAEYGAGQREEVIEALAAHGILERRLPLTDYGNVPAEAFEQAVAQLREWHAEGHRAYVHCRAGWQRSAAVAAAVIATGEGLELGPALAELQRRKPTARPLAHQLEDLLAWWQSRAAGEPSPRPSGPDG